MSVRVLITRDHEKARELVKLLQDRGIESVVEPVTQTAYIWRDQPVPDLPGFAWIAFTSATAVIALAEALHASQSHLPQDISLAAVGKATAAEVEKRLRVPDLVADGALSSARGLAQALAERGEDAGSSTLLWPCSELAGHDFPSALAQAGVKVVPWACYTTQAVPPQILKNRLQAHQGWEAVVFAAPSAVRAFAEAWPGPWPFASVSIGKTTALALQEIGVKPIFVSPSPEAASITETIAKIIE